MIFILLMSSTTFVLGQGSFWDNIDNEVVQWIDAIRGAGLTGLARSIDSLTNEWFLRILRWAVVIALLSFRRWRHLIAFVGTILLVQPLLFTLSNLIARPRPDGIEILADWAGFANPSLTVAALTLTLMGMIYALVVGGRLRFIALGIAALVVVAVALARLYLAVERMTDGLTGALLAVTAVLLVFRIWVPDEVFAVSYARGKKAHLELTEARHEAILTALSEQLGLAAADVRLFALDASAGSSPLLITLEGEEARHVFAKLYAQNHVRSDRWYKVGRSLLYGALEDERGFTTVRALAEYEDYVMRLMESAGVAGPSSLGVVEITKGREYMLVTEFIEGVEISDAKVDATIVDDGLGAVRAMWDHGLAHRDIKPGNVLVADGHLYLIDAAFGEVRPSAWRQAVDLANMMLTLALRTSPQDVYDAAGDYFTDADLAEAFAATKGVTIPSQLNRLLRGDPRDLLGEFRRLVPERTPIRIQRWTRRRVGLLVAAGAGVLVASWLVVVNLELIGSLL